MVLFVRHGSTELNASGDGDRLRGHSDIPLSGPGMQQALRTADMLRKRFPRLDTLNSSDLPRAAHTAEIIGNVLGLPVRYTSTLRGWDTGALTGQPVSHVQAELAHLIQQPEEAPPGGESINEWLNRFEPAARAFVQSPGVHILVGHGRGASVLEGIASPVGGKGQQIDEDYVSGKPNVKPGGILVVSPNWTTKVINPPQTAETPRRKAAATA